MAEASGQTSKALFLDRDGVINKDINYLYRIEDFEFIDGIFEVCHFFQRAKFDIFVVTNQAGIARGLYTEKDFHTLTDWMVTQFRKRAIEIKKVYFCPYHETAGIGKYKQESYDRKPNPGMILKAREEFNLDLSASYLLGNKESDIEAGINAGVGRTILLAETSAPVPTRADLTIHDLRALPALLKLE
ncbi:MAG: D-glycero-alpha-D-manno-heptose-1,7-bisphosphate 7-phosphatase [bacterium]